jgi:succinyl-CoA synthetase alpha subunit
MLVVAGWGYMSRRRLKMGTNQTFNIYVTGTVDTAIQIENDPETKIVICRSPNSEENEATDFLERAEKMIDCFIRGQKRDEWLNEYRLWSIKRNIK